MGPRGQNLRGTDLHRRIAINLRDFFFLFPPVRNSHFFFSFVPLFFSFFPTKFENNSFCSEICFLVYVSNSSCPSDSALHSRLTPCCKLCLDRKFHDAVFMFNQFTVCSTICQFEINLDR